MSDILEDDVYKRFKKLGKKARLVAASNAIGERYSGGLDALDFSGYTLLMLSCFHEPELLMRPPDWL